MEILGFNITKISAEKRIESIKEVKIETKMNILDISPIEIKQLKNTENSLKIKFDYLLDYGKEVAFINIQGYLIISLESPLFKEVIDSWNKKKLPENFQVTIINIIFQRAGIKALLVEDQLNLPLHTPTPSIKMKSKKE